MKTEKNPQKESKKMHQDNDVSSSSEETHVETPNQKAPNKFSKHLRQHVVFYLLLFGCLSYILFQRVSFSSQMNEATIALSEEKEAILANTQKSIDINNEQALTMGMKTFVWAIRKEILNENYEQVNQYILQLIKNKNISEIIITDQEGKITYASNKKFEQTPFADRFDYDLLKVDDIKVEKVGDESLYLITPVMSFNSKLGYVFMVYHPAITKS